MNTLNLNKISSSKKSRPKTWLRKVRPVLGFAFIALVFGSPVFADKDEPAANQTITPPSPDMDTLLSSKGDIGASPAMETAPPQGVIGALPPAPETKSHGDQKPADASSPRHIESGQYKDVVPVVPPSTIKRAGYILPSPESDGIIVANFPKQETIAFGNTVYINIGAGKGVSVGDRFAVSRVEKQIYHPVLKKPLGYLINILGELEVIEVNATDSKAVVRESYQEMMNGDLVTASKPQTPVEDEPKLDEKKLIDGYIIVARDVFADTVSSKMVVFIDQGSQQLVAPGDILEAYETPETADKGILSPRVIGELLVIDTKKDTSTAVVVRSKLELLIGQKIRYKQ